MSSQAKALFLTIVYLSLFGELGVLTRIYLDKLFNWGCSNPGGLCLTSNGTKKGGLGAYFIDLPPNILGSFFMGLLATSATLGLAVAKPVAGLPKKHAWQGNAELFIGLRTGYCGALTTFASWEFQMVLMVFGGNGYAAGQYDQAAWGWFIGMLCAMSALVFGEQVARIFDKLSSAPSLGDTDATTPLIGEAAAEAGVAKIKGNNGAPAGPRFLRKTDAAAILALLGLTGVLVWATVVDSNKSNVSRRAIWVSCLLGPFGVILRWKLSVYNTAQPAALSWFPVGTYLANMIAVVVDYILAADLVYNPSTSIVKALIFPAIKTGFSGSLSTVSTFVNETRSMLKKVPDTYSGYIYPVATILSGLVLAVPFYCWSVWM